MSDTFFEFDFAGVSALGSRKYGSEELLTADVEEEYDALNDETFGDATFDDDWEEDHEKLAHLIKSDCVPQEVSNDALRRLDDGSRKDEEDPQQAIVEQSISHLGLEDDLDDPAIMTFGRSEKCNKPGIPFRYSSIAPPVLDGDVCDLSSNSSFLLSRSMPPNARTLEELECDLISSRTDAWLGLSSSSAADTVKPDLLHSASLPHLSPVNDIKARNDSWWYSSSKDGQLGPNLLNMTNTSHSAVEQPPPVLPISAGSVRTLEDVEKDILLRSQVHTLDEVERNLQVTDHSLHHQKIAPPPGIPAPPQGQRSPANLPLPLGQMNQGTPTSLPIRPHRHAGTAPISPISRAGQTGALPSRLGPQLSPPSVLPPHPLLNPRSCIGPLFPFAPGLLGRVPGKHVPLHLHGQPPFSPNSAKLAAGPLDMRLLHARQIHHPLLNKQAGRNYYPSRTNRRVQEPEKSPMNGTEGDKYAGLMTQKEKEWLIRIQMLQLQTDNPYVTDYYFMTYQVRKIAKEKAAQAKSGEEPQLLLPEIAKQELKVYVPRQFEGSLGKLQVASVNYPRKILEEGVHRPIDDEEAKLPTNSELYWFRKLLMDIEKLYVVLLEIDDEDKRISALSEEAQASHKQLRQQLTDKLYAGITMEGVAEPTAGDRFFQIASIRKGRQLIMRALPFINHHQRIGILKHLFSSLGVILRKDHLDHVLQQHLEYVLKVVHESSLEDIVGLGLSLQNFGSTSHSSPSREKSQMAYALQSTFGSTVICTLIICIEKMNTQLQSSQEYLDKWSIVVFHIIDILCTLPENLLAPSLRFTADVEEHLLKFVKDADAKESLRHRMKILSSQCRLQ